MTLNEWIDALDRIKDKPDIVELVRFLEELKRSRKFRGEYCRQNRTIDQCLDCELYEHGLCVDEDGATNCRRCAKIVIKLNEYAREREKD